MNKQHEIWESFRLLPPLYPAHLNQQQPSFGGLKVVCPSCHWPHQMLSRGSGCLPDKASKHLYLALLGLGHYPKVSHSGLRKPGRRALGPNSAPEAWTLLHCPYGSKLQATLSVASELSLSTAWPPPTIAARSRRASVYLCLQSPFKHWEPRDLLSLCLTVGRIDFNH